MAMSLKLKAKRKFIFMFKFLNRGNSTYSATITIIILVVILVSGILIYELFTEGFEKDVWLESWQYRRLVVVENSANKEVLNYPVLLHINTSLLVEEGKLVSDCRDIRFTDPDSKKFLTHWIEGECDTKDTKIWVNIPFVNPISKKTIHLYYGNEEAEDESLSLPAEDVIITETKGEMILSDNQRNCVRDLNATLYCVMPKANAIYLFKSTNEGKDWQEEKVSGDSALKQMQPVIALDSSNNINIVWQDATSHLYYRQKTTVGWDEIKTIAQKPAGYFSPSIAIDSYNNKHLVYTGKDSVYYWNFLIGKEPTKIAENVANPSIIAGLRSDVFVLYAASDKSIVLRQMITGGWSEEEKLEGDEPVMAVDSKSNIHLIHQENSQLVYLKRTSEGWQEKEVLDTARQSSASIALDKENNVYVVFSRKGESTAYLRKKDSNGWSEAEKITENGWQSNLIWGIQPEENNIYSNIPRQGFAMVYLSTEDSGAQSLRFYSAPFTIYQVAGSELILSIEEERDINDY